MRSIHEPFLAVGCDVVETCTFQSTPRRLEEWGLLDRLRDINVAAARLARAAADAVATADWPRFVAGSMGPTGLLPSSSDPVLSNTTFDALSEYFYQQAQVPGRGWRRRAAHRDVAGHPRGQGGHRRLRATVRGTRPPGARPGAGDAGHERADAARHRHRQRHDHARGPARGRHRTELLDRSGAHAGADPLPGGARHAPGVVHPQRRAAAQHGHGRRGLSAGTGADGPDAGRVRARLRRAHRGRMLRHHAGASGRARPRRGRPWRATHGESGGRRCRTPVVIGAAGIGARAAGVERHARHHPAPGSAAAARRRARELAGLAQGEAPAPGRRLRRASSTSRASRRNRARTCSTSVWRSPSAGTRRSRWRRS